MQIKNRLNYYPDYEIPNKVIQNFNLHADVIEEYNNFHIKKFKIAANNYHTLWYNYKLNLSGKIMRKLSRKYLLLKDKFV